MTTNAPQPAVRPLVFDCPVCGVHATDVDLNLDREVVLSRPLIEMWEGGPVMEDLSREPEPHVVDTWVSTSACRDRFSTWLWDLALIEHPDGRGVLQLTRKAGS